MTAWGEKGEVTVIHNDGISSNSLPYTPKQNKAEITTVPAHAKTPAPKYTIPKISIPDFDIDIPTLDLSGLPDLELASLPEEALK